MPPNASLPNTMYRTLNIEQGLAPPFEHVSRDPPPSPPGYSNPVPASAARNQIPPDPLRRREPEPLVTSGSGSQQSVRRAPLQPLSQTQPRANQPTSSGPPLNRPASLLSRLSPSDVRQEESFGDENVGPSAHSTYVETPTAPNSAEATVTTFVDADPTLFQQLASTLCAQESASIPVATTTYVAPASPNIFTNSAYSNVQESQIPVALSAFPPSSSDTQSTFINNTMGWTTGSQPAAPTSWASLAAQVSNTSWWGPQAFQQPADSPSMAAEDEAMDTSPSYQSASPDADAAMNVDIVDAQMTTPPPIFEQQSYPSDVPNGLPYQADYQQNAFWGHQQNVCSGDQQATWMPAPQMQPNVQDLQICYRDNNTGAWLPYIEPQLYICVFDPTSQTYIPLQLSQSIYVGTSNPLSDQTQSFSSSMHTILDPYRSAEHLQQQNQSSWSSMHTTAYPSQQQYALGPDQQSSSSSMHTISYSFEPYATGAQEQSSISSMPTSSNPFTPFQSEYSSNHPVEVVHPQQPVPWNQQSVDPSVAATLAACNFWDSTSAAVRSQDPSATPFDFNPVPPVGSCYQSQVDPSFAAPQAAYNPGASTSTADYQDPSILNTSFVPPPQVPVDLQYREVDEQVDPWEALQFNIDEEHILSDPFTEPETEPERRQGPYPPPLRLRRWKSRRPEPPCVNDNSGIVFDPQACKQYRMDQFSQKQDDLHPESQSSSTPRKKRSHEESESIATSSRHRIIDEEAEGPIRPSKRARRTEQSVETPVERPNPATTPPRDEFESAATPSRIGNADDEHEGTGPTRSSRRARRSDSAPYTPNSGRRVRWADPITTEGYLASSSRPTRSALRRQRNANANAAPSKSDRICPSLPGIARWFKLNTDGTRL
ncbi:hypothetical protein M413DRAFT_28116 [Hebeloma cylindrosporum]|uniref:Uncharacterized protein n=1 Tax=Hebeloma cylindrosporum TaxID=76867 RepID=A0A0C3BWN4_HEBCY|nr:hypothetical protein M413DRAFT_28116 [Hebeloma cylindrosporum h7]